MEPQVGGGCNGGAVGKSFPLLGLGCLCPLGTATLPMEAGPRLLCVKCESCSR